MFKVGIIGGTGYTGMELMRLLAHHGEAEVVEVTSRSECGQLVSDLFPSLRQVSGLRFSHPDQGNLKGCDLVFSAAPNGIAMSHARELVDAGVRLVDLSADFRLKDIGEWEKWYGLKHQCPELVAEAVYGLPEVYREDIRTAGIVANPGCYPTAVQLGFLPLLKTGLVETGSLVADAKSGVSGAGRKAALGTAFSELSDSFKAYAASGHRHLPEILQGLREMGGGAVELVFIPHLLPMIRGIHATLYARLTEAASATPLDEIQSLYERHYRDEGFVDVLPVGSHPDTRNVRGSNVCRLALHRPPGSRTIVVLAVEDNLVKGAAGQAVQNMNLMLGLDEGCGLSGIALVP
ncbi:MAG: N-acetyl-gamma-glutamyl-phosphate reductase [Gammaproteobacteria bacterium]|nr:N-acetyl-gamma-glutamyl-phosphate reductase [Gammaproteobacteria bacterium]